MKVPKEFEGRMVALQLARPVYLFEYGAHVKYNGEEHLIAKLLVKSASGPGGPDDPEQPPTVAMTDFLMSVLVVSVFEDAITLAIFDPAGSGELGNKMHKTLPTALILSIDEVGGFEVPMPQGTVQVRAQAPKSKLIL